MPIDLTNKPICITGASSGIGRATAIACAEAGMPVVLAARRLDKLEEVVAHITRQGGHAIAHEADVTNPDACTAMIDACRSEFGAVYAVFANAGYGLDKTVRDTTDEELRAIFEANFFGTMNAIRPALPHMIEQGAGHVLVCSSCLGRFTAPRCGAYSATKSAQCHVSRALDLELTGTGVRASAVMPIGTRTEFSDAMIRDSDAPRRHQGNTPKALMQPPERVARAVVRGLKRPKPEIWTSRTIRAVAAIGTAWPILLDWGLRKRIAR